jgi:ABC-type transporter Mla subunit MlaD
MPGVLAVDTVSQLSEAEFKHAYANHSESRDPRTLCTLPEVMSCLSALQSEEAELSNSLEALMAARAPIEASLVRLQSIVPQLEDLHAEAKYLSATVSTTAQTADRIGGKVRSLDEEMRRVRDAGDRVGQVIDLKVRV